MYLPCPRTLPCPWHCFVLDTALSLDTAPSLDTPLPLDTDLSRGIFTAQQPPHVLLAALKMAATTNNRGLRDIELQIVAHSSCEYPQQEEELIARTDTDSSKLLSQQDITQCTCNDSSFDVAPALPSSLHRTVATRILSKLHLLNIAWWIPEIAASLLSSICLALVIVISSMNHGRPITTLKLPTSLSLNATLSVLSTLNRSLLLVPVSSAIMQDLWMWYTARQEGSNCTSTFRHLDVADAASRGPWGSSKLLLYYRGRR